MTVRQEPVVDRIVLSSASYLNYLNIRKLVTTLFLPSSKSRIIFGKISNLVFLKPEKFENSSQESEPLEEEEAIGFLEEFNILEELNICSTYDQRKVKFVQ